MSFATNTCLSSKRFIIVSQFLNLMSNQFNDAHLFLFRFVTGPKPLYILG